MFYYLFAYCRADRSGNTLPAGVLYVPAKRPQLSVRGRRERGGAFARAGKGLCRSGLRWPTRRLSARWTRRGRGAFCRPLQKGRQLLLRLQRGGFGAARQAGAADRPLHPQNRGLHRLRRDARVPLVLDDTHNACTFCDMKPVCRLAGSQACAPREQSLRRGGRVMPVWTESQKRAIETQNRSLLISAGAGSGKTTVLTERILAPSGRAAGASTACSSSPSPSRRPRI